MNIQRAKTVSFLTAVSLSYSGSWTLMQNYYLVYSPFSKLLDCPSYVFYSCFPLGYNQGLHIAFSFLSPLSPLVCNSSPVIYLFFWSFMILAILESRTVKLKHFVLPNVPWLWLAWVVSLLLESAWAFVKEMFINATNLGLEFRSAMFQKPGLTYSIQLPPLGLSSWSILF